MSVRSGGSRSGDAKENHDLGKRRREVSYMSDSQIKAYFITRDVMRRIRRASWRMLSPESIARDRIVPLVSTRDWGRPDARDKMEAVQKGSE